MKISRQENVVVVEDGAGARYGLGVLVPAIVVGVLIVLIWPSSTGHPRFDLGVLAFAIEALVLAVLNPLRVSQFDLGKRRIRLTIGWPPVLGQRMTISFDDIREVKVSQFLRLGNDLGSARCAFILKSGKKMFLSTNKRSPKRCRVVIEQVRPLLGAGCLSAST